MRFFGRSRPSTRLSLSRSTSPVPDVRVRIDSKLSLASRIVTGCSYRRIPFKASYHAIECRRGAVAHGGLLRAPRLLAADGPAPHSERVRGSSSELGRDFSELRNARHPIADACGSARSRAMGGAGGVGSGLAAAAASCSRAVSVGMYTYSRDLRPCARRTRTRPASSTIEIDLTRRSTGAQAATASRARARLYLITSSTPPVVTRWVSC